MDNETVPEPATITLETPDYGNPEINAMARIVEALASVEDEAHERILQWACARFGVSAP